MRLDDGHASLISFSLNPTILFYEKEITPPSISGGEAIDTTTLRNLVWRTKNARKLKSLEAFQLTAAYDPQVYSDILSMINVNQQITITFPSTETYTFWGYVKSFAPGQLVEGQQPTATVMVEPTNQDTSGVETAPVFVDAP